MRFLFPYMARWHSANWSRYHQLLSALSRRGHEVFVLQTPPLMLGETNFIEVDAHREDGLIVREVPVLPGLWQHPFRLEKLIKKGIYTLACRKPVRNLIQDHHIDVLLIYNLPQTILAYDASCLRVLDIADDLAAMLCQEFGGTFGRLVHGLGRAWQKRLASLCDLITVASLSLQDQLAFSTLWIPNGTNLCDGVPATTGKRVRECYGGPVVGYLGAFEYFMNMDLVLEVARRLPEITFLLVGGGRDLKRIHQRVLVEGLNNVILPGPVSHSIGMEYVAAMDVCLIPFKLTPVADGACPLKLFEYAGMKKPVICTRTLEVLRIAKDYVFFANTLDEFVQTIQKLITSPGAFVKQVEHGYEQVKTIYNWDIIAGRFIEAIERSRV